MKMESKHRTSSFRLKPRFSVLTTPPQPPNSPFGITITNYSMASLRLHGGGGYESFSGAAVASSSDKQGCVGYQNRFFPNKNNIKKKSLLISKENQRPIYQQKKAQSHRCSSTSVAANWPAGDKGRAVIPTCDHAYAADHWTEVISKFTAKKSMMVDKEEKKEEDYSSEKLDRWMRDSVVEIVNNIGEAPFLVHIYSDEDDDKSKECSSSKKGMRLVKEKANADSWPTIKGRWDGGISPIPNGVILVEELKPKQVSDKLFDDDDVDDDETKGIDNNSNSQLQYSTTKIWGVLIQAKGLNCSACYIIKTCRVENFLGFCTHFCLLRVECFVDNAETQLKKLWLQR